MTTEPDFRAVTLDDTVAIVLTTERATDEAPTSPVEDAMDLEATPPQIIAAVSVRSWDHGLAIGNLPSASKKVCSVKPDATFEEAITLMLTEGFSQLAVMTQCHGLRLDQRSWPAFRAGVIVRVGGCGALRVWVRPGCRSGRAAGSTSGGLRARNKGRAAVRLRLARRR